MIKRFKFLFTTIECINWIAVELSIFSSFECINLPDLDTLQLHVSNFQSNSSFIYMLKLFVVGTPRKRRRAVDEEAVQIPLAKGYV